MVSLDVSFWVKLFQVAKRLRRRLLSRDYPNCAFGGIERIE